MCFLPPSSLEGLQLVLCGFVRPNSAWHHTQRVLHTFEVNRVPFEERGKLQVLHVDGSWERLRISGSASVCEICGQGKDACRSCPSTNFTTRLRFVELQRRARFVDFASFCL